MTGETAENHTTLWVGVVILCGAILCLCVVIVRSLPVWAARRQRERGQRFSDGDAAAETPGGSATRGLPREVTPVGVEMGANGVEGGVEKGAAGTGATSLRPEERPRFEPLDPASLPSPSEG